MVGVGAIVVRRQDHLEELLGDRLADEASKSSRRIALPMWVTRRRASLSRLPSVQYVEHPAVLEVNDGQIDGQSMGVPTDPPAPSHPSPRPIGRVVLHRSDPHPAQARRPRQDGDGEATVHDLV